MIENKITRTERNIKNGSKVNDVEDSSSFPFIHTHWTQISLLYAHAFNIEIKSILRLKLLLLKIYNQTKRF